MVEERLGLLTSTWLLQKRARLSEQDLCEECLKSRRGVQIFCAELSGQSWEPIGTITNDEGIESFQVPEVQPVENSDASARKEGKINNVIMKRLASRHHASSVEPFSVEMKQSPLVTVPNVVFVWKLR